MHIVTLMTELRTVCTTPLEPCFMAHAYNPSYSGGRDKGGLWLKASPRQIILETLSQKNPSKKPAGEVAQVVGVPA
jgi:hypothetical protein